MVRFNQELARVKNDFVAHFYFWLDQKISSGFLALTLSLGIWLYLHLNEVPGDLAMLFYTFTPTVKFTQWIKSLSKPYEVWLFMVNYFTWLFTDVYLSLYFADNGAMYSSHKVETVLSLILSYIYQVVPQSLLLII